MGVAKQLHQLQETDLELESSKQALRRTISQLGESRAVSEARARLNSGQQRLKELNQEQHSTEWEIDDLGTKLNAIQDKLYSGRIGNPKELGNLQREAEGMKARRAQLEEKALGIMEKVEQAEASVAALSDEFNRLEADWQSQQQQLTTDMEQLKTAISDLEYKQQLLLGEIDPQAVELYQELKKRKGKAVAGVEQGICSGCRISLTTSKLQQVRGGNIVQCDSCGRIMCLIRG